MTTTPKRAARETDFYSLESPELDPYQVPPLLFETLLSKVEAWGKEFIDAAVADPGFVIDDELRARFSRYMGFQYVRGCSARWFAEAAANDLIKIKYEDVTSPTMESETCWRRTGKSRIDRSDGFESSSTVVDNGKIRITPQERPWSQCWASKPKASDSACSFAAGTSTKFRRSWSPARNPWLPIAGPPHPRGERAGVADAGVVIFPLTSSLLLAIVDGVARPVSPYRLDHCDIAEVNREIVAAASGYAFERLGRNTAAAFKLPKAADPMHRSDPMPMDNTGLRRIIRVHRPSRWADDAAPPRGRWNAGSKLPKPQFSSRA